MTPEDAAAIRMLEGLLEDLRSGSATVVGLAFQNAPDEAHLAVSFAPVDNPTPRPAELDKGPSEPLRPQADVPGLCPSCGAVLVYGANDGAVCSACTWGAPGT